MMNNASLEQFETKLRGPLLRPESDDYDNTRRLWNAMVDQKPALIARCTGVADVVESVNFAQEHSLPLAVRGGGHNVAGLASVDDGLMIDLSLMDSVHVDPEERTARVQGGATWSAVDHETQLFGLATPSGIISTTGVGGLTLGGGFGWLSRKHGLTVDNLLSADLVTAGGEVVKASPNNNPDLFWAIRGGGGNFGIVTSFEFQLHDAGPQVLFGPTIYQLKDAAEALRHYQAFASDAPNECTVYADFMTAPPLPFIPKEVQGTTVLFMIQMYVGSIEEGLETLKPLREFGNPVADAVAPTLYKEAQCRSDPLFPKGRRYYWKSHNITALSDEIIDELVSCAKKLPTAQCDILIQQLGGRINEVAPDSTAYPHRKSGFVATLGAQWEQEAQDDEPVAWARDCHAALGEHVQGSAYVNFLSHNENQEWLQAAYGNNADRLRRVKAQYDPNNFFRRNHNIVPSAAG
ncbi:FAD-binding oxidoreductase [Marinimicrobium sp. ABcell2]|uniref:FAD-binding oxidoreductase n=1 Tax=Marinimicrobium sp. ABcell2 TaxID=3069751 RepID=UPI0027AFAC3B|nr:FAD-binding oxidoreductase [Marinimicrobium sp. ABcell2]MDQ2077977.1 FAD-binding oxidoreductase [Marinimicrobium sp. ABcell2]